MKTTINLMILFFALFYSKSSMGCDYCEVPQAYADEESLILKSDSILMIRVTCTEGKTRFYLEKTLKGKTEDLSIGDELKIYDKKGDKLLFCDEMANHTLTPLDGRVILFANHIENVAFRIAHGTRCSFWPVKWEGWSYWGPNADSIAICSRNAKEERRRNELFINAMMRYDNAAREGIDQVFDFVREDMDKKEMLPYAIRYVGSSYSIFNKQGNERERILIGFIAFKHLEQLQGLESFSFRDVETMDSIIVFLPQALQVKYQLWRLGAMLDRGMKIRESFRAGEFVLRLFDLVEKECPENNAMSNGHLVNLRKQWSDHIDKFEKVSMGRIEIFNLDDETCNEILVQCTAELCKNWTSKVESSFFIFNKLDTLERDCYKEILLKMRDEIHRKPEVIKDKK